MNNKRLNTKKKLEELAFEYYSKAEYWSEDSATGVETRTISKEFMKNVNNIFEKMYKIVKGEQYKSKVDCTVISNLTFESGIYQDNYKERRDRLESLGFEVIMDEVNWLGFAVTDNAETIKNYFKSIDKDVTFKKRHIIHDNTNSNIKIDDEINSLLGLDIRTEKDVTDIFVKYNNREQLLLSDIETGYTKLVIVLSDKFIFDMQVKKFEYPITKRDTKYLAIKEHLENDYSTVIFKDIDISDLAVLSDIGNASDTCNKKFVFYNLDFSRLIGLHKLACAYDELLSTKIYDTELRFIKCNESKKPIAIDGMIDMPGVKIDARGLEVVYVTNCSITELNPERARQFYGQQTYYDDDDDYSIESPLTKLLSKYPITLKLPELLLGIDETHYKVLNSKLFNYYAFKHISVEKVNQEQLEKALKAYMERFEIDVFNSAKYRDFKLKRVFSAGTEDFALKTLEYIDIFGVPNAFNIDSLSRNIKYMNTGYGSSIEYKAKYSKIEKYIIDGIDVSDRHR